MKGRTIVPGSALIALFFSETPAHATRMYDRPVITDAPGAISLAALVFFMNAGFAGTVEGFCRSEELR